MTYKLKHKIDIFLFQKTCKYHKKQPNFQLKFEDRKHSGWKNFREKPRYKLIKGFRVTEGRVIMGFYFYCMEYDYHYMLNLGANCPVTFQTCAYMFPKMCHTCFNPRHTPFATQNKLVTC